MDTGIRTGLRVGRVTTNEVEGGGATGFGRDEEGPIDTVRGGTWETEV